MSLASFDKVRLPRSKRGGASCSNAIWAAATSGNSFPVRSSSPTISWSHKKSNVDNLNPITGYSIPNSPQKCVLRQGSLLYWDDLSNGIFLWTEVLPIQKFRQPLETLHACFNYGSPQHVCPWDEGGGCVQRKLLWMKQHCGGASNFKLWRAARLKPGISELWA